MKNLQSVTLGLLCLLMTTHAFAQNAFSGVFHTISDSTILAENLSWQEIKGKDKTLSASGFKLVDIEAIANKEEEGLKYYGLWKKDTSHTIMLQIPGWDSLVQAKRKMVKKGYLMTDAEAKLGKDGRYNFVCIWERKKIWHKVWKLDTWEGLVKKNREMVQQFLYIRDVEAIQSPNEGVKFLAVYHEGDRERKQRTHVFHAPDLETFNTDQWQRKTSGYYMIDFESFEVDGKTHYLGIYQKGENVHALRQNFVAKDFKQHSETLQKNFYRLADIEIGKGEGRKEENTQSKATAQEQN